MPFKRSLMLSLVMALAGAVCAYVLAWGLFTTHPELGMEPASGLAISLWVAPLIFLGSLLYFATRKRRDD